LVSQWTFLLFLGFNLVGGFARVFWRYPPRPSGPPRDAPRTPEAAVLRNNRLFVMIGFVVLWGVVYPLITQAFQGETVTVGRPFYDVVSGPLFLALVALMGVGPLVPWRRASKGILWRTLRVPLAVGLAVVVGVAVLGVRSPLPMLAFAVCGFVTAGILREWARGTQVRRRRGESYPVAFARLLLSNRPRYGGYLTHLAIVMLAFSVTGSSFYSVQEDFSLAPGERAAIGGYEVEFLGASVASRADRVEHSAQVQVYRDGKPIKQLSPGYTYYSNFDMASTQAGIRSTPVEDLYVIASEFSDGGRAIFRIYVNPLIVWMWLAGPLMILGTVVSLWPERPRVSRTVSQLRAGARRLAV
jgi:cytochrome c-type biogenesis protein CcmF